jgi:hypothetical protein
MQSDSAVATSEDASLTREERGRNQMSDDAAVTFIVTALKHVCANEGTDAALDDAEKMVFAAMGIIARERGLDHALAVLDRSARVLATSIHWLGGNCVIFRIITQFRGSFADASCAFRHPRLPRR